MHLVNIILGVANFAFAVLWFRKKNYRYAAFNGFIGICCFIVAAL